MVGSIQFWRGCEIYLPKNNRNTSPFLGLHARADSVHTEMGAGGQGGRVAFNSEHLPVFRAPREVGCGPSKNADTVHAKKLHEKGTNRQINGHRDSKKELA